MYAVSQGLMVCGFWPFLELFYGFGPKIDGLTVPFFLDGLQTSLLITIREVKLSQN